MRLNFKINQEHIKLTDDDWNTCYKWALDTFGTNNFEFAFARRSTSGLEILPHRFKFRYKKDMYWFMMV